MGKHTIVADLGKRRDRGAFFVWEEEVGIVESKQLPIWTIVHLDLFQKVTYHDMVADLALLMGLPEIQADDADLLVDGQNVGEAVLEIMRDNGLSPISIITTGGQTVRPVRKAFGEMFGRDHDVLSPLGTFDEINVPKNDLVAAGRHLAQQRRVVLAKDLKWASEFKKQMRGFRGFRSTRSTEMKYEAATELVHDDFVWCYLAASWWSTRGGYDEIEEEVPDVAKLKEWDPLEAM